MFETFYLTGQTVFWIKSNETSLPSVHILAQGGMKMEIKHTHPEYKDSKQREDALKGAKQACINAVAVLKENAHKFGV